MITYPVKAVGGRSHQLEDARGRPLGSVEAAKLINANQPPAPSARPAVEDSAYGR